MAKHEGVKFELPKKLYVGHETKEGFGPLKHKGAKGKMKPQTSGHIDHAELMHDAKGHEKGSRGPFTKKETGKSKTK